MAIAARFRQEVTVEVATPGAATPRGHQVVAYVDGATFRCSIQERRSQAAQGAEVDAPDHDQLVPVMADAFLPIDAPMTERDRLRVRATGVRYEVVGPLRDAGGRGRHLEAELQRLKP